MRNPIFNNFETAKSIGLIIDAENKDILQAAKKLMADFRANGIKTRALVFIKDADSVSSISEEINMQYFDESDFGIFFRPKSKGILDYCSKKFDLLIDLSFNSYLGFKYLVAYSNARCKIGKDVNYSFVYDIMIDVPDGKSAHYYIEQLNHYMSVIKVSPK